MNSNDLKTMYGTTPESFKHRVSFALKQTEGKPVKHTMRTVLIAAAVVVLLTAAAYAAFSSQVLDLFGRSYGNDMEQWLKQGDVAVSEQSLVLDGVVFTLDEVIYRDNGLYGVGTIRPLEGSNIVIIGKDFAPDEPFGYDIHGLGGVREEAPAGTPTIADVAREKGAKLLVVRTLPEQIGVDGGPLLYPPCVGYMFVPERDGSVQFLFDVSDATVIAEGEVYTIAMHSSVTAMDLDGTIHSETYHGENWTVEISPKPIGEPTAEPAANTVALTQSIGDVELIVPDGYSPQYTMPVYAAIPNDFGKALDPTLFNQSGIAKSDKRSITFNDEAELSWSTETLYYYEFQGTRDANYRIPDSEPMIVPVKSLSNAAGERAADAYSAWLKGEEGIVLSKTELAEITLEEAKAKVEAILKAVNVKGYTCDFALDMDVERIRTLGEAKNRKIEENQSWNSPIMDYSKAGPETEGYFLHYTNGFKADGGYFYSIAYVTEEGVVLFQLRDMYSRGDIYATPDALISPETVMDRLAAEIADSRFAGLEIDHIISIELCYSPGRAADKADGMVLTPAWYVVYQDNDGVKGGFESYAIFNAVDGTLLYAPFQ